MWITRISCLRANNDLVMTGFEIRFYALSLFQLLLLRLSPKPFQPLIKNSKNSIRSLGFLPGAVCETRLG